MNIFTRGLEMITVYEIKSNGFLGAAKEIAPSEGVSSNWTHAAPPAEGSYRWEAGDWVLGVEPASSEPAISEGQASDDARTERNTRLGETDWTQVRDAPDATAAKWAAYRQALRDVPSQSGFPIFVDWPEKPE
jgi:hypothetical protein